MAWAAISGARKFALGWSVGLAEPYEMFAGLGVLDFIIVALDGNELTGLWSFETHATFS